jgi:hypothetical protein
MTPQTRILMWMAIAVLPGGVLLLPLVLADLAKNRPVTRDDPAPTVHPSTVT